LQLPTNDSIDKSRYVDTLKKAIKPRNLLSKTWLRATSGSGRWVYATAANRILTLKMCKVSSLHAQPAGVTSLEEVPGAQEQADPLSRLSAALPVELVDGHVHVIVVPPGYKKSLDIEAIDEKINKELDLVREVVETFLKNPEPRTWIPPDSVTPSNRQFLTNLRIPYYRNGDPSLLFHNLDVYDDKEIEMIFGPGAHQYVVINCALNIPRHVQAGTFATHLARAKPVAFWKASQSTGDSTSLQSQISQELAFEI
jgi:hypothetical protein